MVGSEQNEDRFHDEDPFGFTVRYAFGMKQIMWNPWHGCHPYSKGCQNCFMRRADERYGRDPDRITKSKAGFDLPLKKDRQGNWKIPSGSLVSVCFNSDFFIEEADSWRTEAWRMMKIRSDLRFCIPTKRVLRMQQCLPKDWGNGYSNVTFALSVESQRAAKERIDAFLKIPCFCRQIFAAPLLEEIDLLPWLKTGQIALVSVAGESGLKARVCQFSWMETIYQACRKTKTRFVIHQTGRNFVKDGRLYQIQKKDQFSQARKAESYLRRKHRIEQPALFGPEDG